LHGDGEPLDFGPMVCVGRAAEDELRHADDLVSEGRDEDETVALVEGSDQVAIPPFELGRVDAV
jgi:hypothetical protein